MKLTRKLRITLATGCCLLGAGSANAADFVIYDEALAPGWAGWSWAYPDGTVTQYDPASTAQAKTGSHSFAVFYPANAYLWPSISLQAPAPVAGTTEHATLRFSLYVPEPGHNITLYVHATNNNNATVQLSDIPANVWNDYTIPLASLGAYDQFTGLTALSFQNNGEHNMPTIYLDDVMLTGDPLPPPPPPPPQAGPALSIDSATDLGAISPDIYGINFATEGLASAIDLPLRRWGGNATTRYNWQQGVSNRASDWFFENIPDALSPGKTPPYGTDTDQFVEQDIRTGTRTMLTVSVIGYTPKRRELGSDPYPDCGFPVEVYGPQQYTDGHCGNGIDTHGNLLAGDPSITSLTIDSGQFAKDWVTHLITEFPQHAPGSYYSLDNEPMLWNSTHRDVHPQGTSIVELLNKSIPVARKVKEADPAAKVTGPAVWGWCAYLFSAADGNCSAGAEHAAYGDVVPYYLQQMRAAEMNYGVRLLDYLDLHYYVSTSNVSQSDYTNPGETNQRLRLESTRSLWDPTYVSDHAGEWEVEPGVGPAKIQLIPRMRDWVNANYPGTKLALTEYNWGGMTNINGALAQADVLGIFGREGMDLATLWSTPLMSGTPENLPVTYAFRMYRNYDGNHGSFGDRLHRATSADQGRLSVYAARRSSDQALTVMAINKTVTTDLVNTPVQIAGLSGSVTAQVYRYSAANLNAIERLADRTITGGSFQADFPVNSITLFVIPPAGPSQDTTPEPFTFVDVTGAVAGQGYTSNAITVAGIDAPAPVSLVCGGDPACAYSSDNGASWHGSSESATVNAGQQLRVRVTASASAETTVSAQLTIGGVADSFEVTTAAAPPPADTTPDPFAFTAVTGAVAGQAYTSNAITVTGIDAPAPLSLVCSGDPACAYSTDNGASWHGSSESSTVNAGQQVQLRVSASGSPGATVSAQVTIGGVAGSYEVTTAVAPPADTTPAQFLFKALAKVPLSTTVTSAPVRITGINAAAPWSATGGEACVSSYKNCACNVAPWGSSGTILNNQFICARHTSAATRRTATQTEVDVGGVSATFTSTTVR